MAVLQGVYNVLPGPLLQILHCQGPVIQGPVLQGPVLQGPVLQGPVLQGPVLQGPMPQGSAQDLVAYYCTVRAYTKWSFTLGSITEMGYTEETFKGASSPRA